MTVTILPEQGHARPPAGRSSSGRRAIVAVVAVAVLAAGGAGYALTRDSAPASAKAPAAKPRTAPAPKTASQWIAAALAAANQRGTVHIDVAATADGRSLTYSDDDGLDVGIQRITVAGGGQATVRVVGDATYLLANEAALVGYFQFPPAAAARVVGRWLLFETGDPGYDQVTEGVTLASAMEQMKLEAPLTLLPARVINGKRVIGVRGHMPAASAAGATATGTLWVSASGDPLPVSYEMGSNKKGTMTVKFSKWGAHLSVSAPPDAAKVADVLTGRA